MNDASPACRLRPFLSSQRSARFPLTASSTRSPRRFVSGLLSFSIVTLATLVSIPAWASAVEDADTQGASSAAGNGRAVRLSYLEGSVRVTQGDQVIADPAVVNMPLFEGVELATAADGRAEVQLDDGSIVRLSPNTTLDFTVMQLQGTAPRTELTLRGGLAYFEVQPSNAEHRMRVRYDDASFTASEASIVRITRDQPPAELAVLSGGIHLERAGGLQLDMHAGEGVTLEAADPSRYSLATSITPNSWDNWNADRDQVLNSEAAEQTSATANGRDPSGAMGDLDANGNWYNVPGEGYVWAPYDAQDAGEGWDPYGYGNWVSYPQYGYVWVSGYSWGYSPFSCGLWDYYDDFGWAWAPGGCRPWWGFGGGGWGYRIGNNRPPGYRPPHRPRPPLRGGPGDPGTHRLRPEVVAGTHRMPANPVIAIDRRSVFAGVNAGSREGGTATIAGHSVEPLRPIGRVGDGFRDSNDGSGNPASDPGQGMVITSRGQTSAPASHARPIYTPPVRMRPEGGGMPGGQHSEPSRYEPNRPAMPQPTPRPYNPPPAPHYSPPPPSPPPPHVSSPPPASHPHH